MKRTSISDFPIYFKIEGCDEPKTAEEIIAHLNQRAKRLREERQRKSA